jgi:hypothetical protein
MGMAEESQTILQEAQGLIYGERQGDYGPPHETFEPIAQMWSAILGTPITAKQVALCMAALKLCREAYKPKRDNLVDLAGYAGVAQRIQERK